MDEKTKPLRELPIGDSLQMQRHRRNTKRWRKLSHESGNGAKNTYTRQGASHLTSGYLSEGAQKLLGAGMCAPMRSSWRCLRQPRRGASVDGGRGEERWYTDTLEHGSATEGKGASPSTVTWTDLEGAVPSGVCPTEKGRCDVSSLTCGV